MSINRSDGIGLLVGVGSMGKRHAKILIQKYTQVIVVDPNLAIGEWVKIELRDQDRYFQTLESALTEVAKTSSQITAIIATQGPSHFPIFNQLVDAGVRRILCEKPLANSIDHAQQMVDRAERENVRLSVGMQRRRSGLVPQLLAAAEKYLGGRPVGIVGHGGAQCLITTGMHWIDLAIDIFGEAPIAVSAVAEPDMINPRGKDLEMWAGVAGWSFSGGRYLALTYSNLSSVEGMLHIYCPTGRLDIGPNGELLMYQRNADQIQNDPRITRVGEAFISTEFHVIDPPSHPTLLALSELDSNDKLLYSSQDALISLTAALGALCSAQDNVSVQFPLTEGKYLHKEWAVS